MLNYLNSQEFKNIFEHIPADNQEEIVGNIKRRFKDVARGMIGSKGYTDVLTQMGRLMSQYDRPDNWEVLPLELTQNGEVKLPIITPKNRGEESKFKQNLYNNLIPEMDKEFNYHLRREAENIIAGEIKDY